MFVPCVKIRCLQHRACSPIITVGRNDQRLLNAFPYGNKNKKLSKSITLPDGPTGAIFDQNIRLVVINRSDNASAFDKCFITVSLVEFSRENQIVLRERT